MFLEDKPGSNFSKNCDLALTIYVGSQEISYSLSRSQKCYLFNLLMVKHDSNGKLLKQKLHQSSIFVQGRHLVLAFSF